MHIEKGRKQEQVGSQWEVAQSIGREQEEEMGSGGRRCYC